MLSIDDYPHTWERIVNQANILGGGNEKRTDLLLFSAPGFRNPAGKLRSG